ncbi:MAG TPA: ribosomal protein S18-alanine N-acetyltransferase [Jatrophihabitantaceae bacterium]|jgi:ribosomal-protein-alanine N-acetyltransferase|nr:ribosomal protein S18-alanine N-acetyltransferase [Jatrophihabitantaceae bacterium]
MSVIDVVPMTRAHIDALMPFEREMFGTEAWSADGYRAELADTRHRYYLAAVDENESLLGWAGVRVVGDTAEILTVGVVPQARRQGIGGRLLAMLLDEATRRGAVEAFLEVRVDNTAAQQLYEQARFVRVGIRRGYYAEGRVDAVVMRRAI